MWGLKASRKILVNYIRTVGSQEVTVDHIWSQCELKSKKIVGQNRVDVCFMDPKTWCQNLSNLMKYVHRHHAPCHVAAPWPNPKHHPGWLLLRYTWQLPHEKKRWHKTHQHVARWAFVALSKTYAPSIPDLTRLYISTLTSRNEIHVFIKVLWTKTHSETTYKAVWTWFKRSHTVFFPVTSHM